MRNTIPRLRGAGQDVLLALLQETDRVLRDPRDYEDWVYLRYILDATPLHSDEYMVMVNRLGNVRRYLAAGEHGAAIYELRLFRAVIARATLPYVENLGIFWAYVPIRNQAANHGRAADQTPIIAAGF